MNQSRITRRNNPCLGCDYYDCDFDCICPEDDKWYACEPEPAPEEFITVEEREKERRPK